MKNTSKNNIINRHAELVSASQNIKEMAGQARHDEQSSARHDEKHGRNDFNANVGVISNFKVIRFNLLEIIPTKAENSCKGDVILKR